MKKSLVLICFASMLSNFTLAQCDVRFGSADGRFLFTDVETGESGLQTVTAGNTEVLTLTTSHDLWNELINDCSVLGGVEDVTIIQTLNTVPYDVYGGAALVGDASDKMNITQNSAGLSGTNTQGSLSSSRSSTGDVKSYTIEVNFASHVYIEAQDLIVKLGSVNTAGKAFESSSIIFKNDVAAPAEYGTVTYNGFWDDPDGSGGTHPGVVGSCPAVAPTINPTVYTTTGTGTYVMGETGTVDLTNACQPTSGVNGADDTKNVRAVEDAGLNPSDRITGFIFQARVENVGTATADGVYNGTSTNFTSRLTGFDFANSSFVLPVELTEFTARTDQESTFLNWRTATEENNDYFSIEHSLDGNTFEEIGQVNGNGTTSYGQDYSFVHKNPSRGLNYYRLKQFDFDGAFEYSQIRVINVKKENSIHIFPIQVSEKITIDLAEATKEETLIGIYDVMGRMVWSEVLGAEATRRELNVANLAKGHYFIQLHTGNERQTKRFLKMN